MKKTSFLGCFFYVFFKGHMNLCLYRIFQPDEYFASCVKCAIEIIPAPHKLKYCLSWFL